MKVSSSRFDGLLMFVIGSIFFLGIGAGLERFQPLAMSDFMETYSGARCLLQHQDPYQPDQLWAVYQQQPHIVPSSPILAHELQLIVSICTNLPTTLALIALFAALPWSAAQTIWTALIAASFLVGALLIWFTGGSAMSRFNGLVLWLLLTGSGLLLSAGNPAGLVVGLAVIAACCFLRDRFVVVGILCLAVALLVKPHDAGPVWLYFLLAGGLPRKRALQTFAVTALLAAIAILWVSHIAPHWPQELHSNLSASMAPGGRDYPGPQTAGGRGVGMVISLQALFSLIHDNPHFYNPLVYAIGGVLLLIWAVKTLRSRFTPQLAWFALAAIAPMAILPLYHRTYDASILLLTIPACGVLWTRRGPLAWCALLLNLSAIVLTGDLLDIVFFQLTHYAPWAVTLGVIPGPVILLALAVFYLVVYLHEAAASANVNAPLSGASP